MHILSNLNRKNVVAGLGEIGTPIFKLLAKKVPTIGYDINPKLIDKKLTQKYDGLKTDFLHICIPYTKRFYADILTLNKKFKPNVIVIHSTISPTATEQLQKKLTIPILYSATRGVHKRMLYDLKRYTKFYSVYDWAPNAKQASHQYEKLMKKLGIKTKKMSSPITLELAKIVVDTSYYGWLITYAQLSNMIAIKHKVNYDEMWQFSDEIHKFLGNRPKMFPGFIGGHCVLPNLDLIKDDTLNLIKEINSDYAEILKKRRPKTKNT